MTVRPPSSRSAAPAGAARRRVAAASLAIVALVSVTGCVGGGTEVATASMRSDPRPVGELAPRDEEDGRSQGGGSEGGVDDGLPLPDLGLPDLDLPDLGVPDVDPGISDECVELSFAYTELVAAALAGDPNDEIDPTIDDLVARAPEDVRDDLEVVRRTLNTAADEGLIDAGRALLSDDFLAANDRVTQWIGSQCTVAEGS